MIWEEAYEAWCRGSGTAPSPRDLFKAGWDARQKLVDEEAEEEARQIWGPGFDDYGKRP